VIIRTNGAAVEKRLAEQWSILGFRSDATHISVLLQRRSELTQVNDQPDFDGGISLVEIHKFNKGH